MAVGRILSILTFAVAGLLTLPALSVHVPDTGWPAPSVVSVTGGVQESMPERSSVPVVETFTLPLFHPLPFGAGVRTSVAVGGVLSGGAGVYRRSMMSFWPMRLPSGEAKLRDSPTT